MPFRSAPETPNSNRKSISQDAGRAYGFHFARAALALILFACGPVTLTLPHDRFGV